jgi:hypothetical protein
MGGIGEWKDGEIKLDTPGRTERLFDERGCKVKRVFQHRFWPGGLGYVVQGWYARDPAGRKGYVPREQGPGRLQRLRGTAALQA